MTINRILKKAKEVPGKCRFFCLRAIILAAGLLIISGSIFGGNPATAGDSEKEREDVQVLMNNLPVEFDQPPLIVDGRTLVPFRAVAEALGVQVAWNEDAREIQAESPDVSLLLQVDSKTATVDEQQVELDVAPAIFNGRTLVPLRFFTEAFGVHVDWCGEDRKVSLESSPVSMWVTGFYALGSRQASSWEDLFGLPYPETTLGQTELVDELALGWYSLNQEGELLTSSRTGWERPSGWERLLEAAEQYGLRTEMVVHVTDGDGTVTELMDDPGSINKLAGAVAEEAERYYEGVNLNIEGLGWSEQEEELEKVREQFTALVQQIADKLEPLDLTLTLTIHAPNSAYQGYDYRDLGEIADRIIVMAHDYGPSPEPKDKVLEAVEQASYEVDPGKLILAVSAPSETPESLQVKLEIARRHQLKGVSLWRLGLMGPSRWEALSERVLRH